MRRVPVCFTCIQAESAESRASFLLLISAVRDMHAKRRFLTILKRKYGDNSSSYLLVVYLTALSGQVIQCRVVGRLGIIINKLERMRKNGRGLI